MNIVILSKLSIECLAYRRDDFTVWAESYDTDEYRFMCRVRLDRQLMTYKFEGSIHDDGGFGIINFEYEEPAKFQQLPHDLHARLRPFLLGVCTELKYQTNGEPLFLVTGSYEYEGKTWGIELLDHVAPIELPSDL